MSKRQRAGDAASAHDQHTIAEVKQPVMQLNSAFKQRFGPVGEALADVLIAFSLDIVGIVAGYAVCGVAKAGDKPQLLFSFGSDNLLGSCYGLSVSPGIGQILAAGEAKLAVFDDRGDFKQLVGSQSQELKHPDGIAFDSSGQAFVVAHALGHVVVVSPDFALIRTIGTEGSGDGQMTDARGLALHGELLFVADSGNNRIVVFTTEGKFVRTWPTAGYPMGVAASRTGEVFTHDGTKLREFGHKGSGHGELKEPMGLAIDRAGSLLVCDTHNDRVQVLSAEGAFITEFANDMEAQPWSVHSDREGRILVGDSDGRVHVFAFEA